MCVGVCACLLWHVIGVCFSVCVSACMSVCVHVHVIYEWISLL